MSTAREYFLPYSENVNAPWNAILHLGQEQCCPTGHTFLHGAQPAATGLWFVREGLVRYSVLNPQGREKVVLYSGKNTIVGEVSAFDARPFSGSFISCCPSRLVFFTVETVRQQIAPHYPELMLNLLETLSMKMRFTVSNLQQLSTSNIPQHVATFFCKLDEEKDGLQGWLNQLSQEEVARILGISIGSLTRVIRQFKDEGLLETFSRNKLRIANKERLLELSRQGE